MVWMKWRQNKIPFESAEYDLIHCRDWHAGSMLDKLRLLDRLEREYKERQEMEHYMQLLDKNMLPFVTTKELDDWIRDHDKIVFGRTHRWKVACFVGTTNTAKSKKAASLFPGRTLKVSCNGLPLGILPSLKEFKRSDHDAILFDEIRMDQVLGNRELFQAGIWPTKLAQSACSQHEYKVWCYGTAMILATSSIQINMDTPTAESDAKWLEDNLELLRPPAGHKVWYVKPETSVEEGLPATSTGRT